VKKSREIVDLPIVGITEGTRLGRVKGLLVDPGRKAVAYLLSEVTDPPGEVLLLPFERVVGIGEHALTIEKRSAMEPVSRFPDAVGLLLKNVPVVGQAVMDKKGALRGTVSEYLVMENDGVIAGCFLAGNDHGVIPAAAIITYSPSYVIVNDDFSLTEEGTAAPPPAPDTARDAAPAAVAPPKPEKNGFDTFVEKQREFLTGRTVGADIVDAEGRIVAREGEVVTEELIERVIAADRYVELTMSTR